MAKYDKIDILLVEDNPRDADLTIRALRKNHLANNVFHLEDGVQALDYLKCRGEYANKDNNDNPKVIFLDLKLPKLSGLEVLKQIRSNDNLKNLPVVILTSSNEDPDIKAAYEIGANSYVVKPVDFKAFQDSLSHLGFYWLLINEVPR